VFRNAVGNRIKVLLWDGNGVWLCQRRLHQGHFIWPKPGECRFSITQAQWEWLIAGVDWHRLSAHPPPIPTERSVRISRTTLFNQWFTAQK